MPGIATQFVVLERTIEKLESSGDPKLEDIAKLMKATAPLLTWGRLAHHWLTSFRRIRLSELGRLRRRVRMPPYGRLSLALLVAMGQAPIQGSST